MITRAFYYGRNCRGIFQIWDHQEDLDTKKPRVKIHNNNKTRRQKGDAIMTYLKEPSVDFPFQIFDGTPLRLDEEKLMSIIEKYKDTFII